MTIVLLMAVEFDVYKEFFWLIWQKFNMPWKVANS